MKKSREFEVARKVYRLPIALIRPFEDQPRREFNEDDINQLAGSMEDCDQQEPIKVIEIEDPIFKFELVDGERRFRAAKKAGFMYIEAIIVIVKDRNDQFARALTLNFCKKRHSHLEAADAVHRLITKNGMTQAQIARRIGKDLMWVSNHASVGANLIPEVREMMSGNLPRNERLPFTSAVRVSKMRRDRQLRGAKIFLLHGVKAADRIIRTQADSLGIKTRSSRTPRDDFRVLKNFVTRTTRELATYGDLKQEFFDAMFCHRTEEDPIYMIADLKRIIQQVGALAGKINTALDNKKRKQQKSVEAHT